MAEKNITLNDIMKAAVHDMDKIIAKVKEQKKQAKKEKTPFPKESDNWDDGSLSLGDD